MQLSAPGLTIAQRTSTLFRLLTVALAGLAVAIGGQPLGTSVLALEAGYLVTTASLWLLAPYLRWAWLIYPIAVLDVSVVTGVVMLVGPTPLPVWILYLFPVAGATLAGGTAAVVATGLSIGAYVSVVTASTGVIPVTVIWPVTTLIGFTLVNLVLSKRWIAERQRRRAWQEIAAALRAVGTKDGIEQAATAVVESARLLVRADRSWLWWYGDNRQLRDGPQAGTGPLEPIPSAAITPAFEWKLRRGPVSISALGECCDGLSGEVVALRKAGEIIALLAVTWKTAPDDLRALREQIRILAPSAGEALAEARNLTNVREGLRREEVLRRAATSLASTLDKQVVRETLLIAARSGLGAAACIVERSTGRVLSGDMEVSEALVKLTVDAENMGTETDAHGTSSRLVDVPLSIMIEANLALIVWRGDPPLDDGDASWLGQLAALARGALERCADYERLRADEERLRTSLEAMQSPLALWDLTGNLVLANTSFRNLCEGVVAPSVSLLPGEVNEQEFVLGNPPRTFIAMTSLVPEAQHLVTVYRDITRERDALRAKDELIAMAGHELRTPLTSIAGYSQLMARQLGVIQQQVGQLNNLIGDFVDASLREDTQLAMDRRLVDVAGLVRQAAERFQGSHPEHTLRLVLSETPTIEGDPGRLEQVLDNLLGNAAKYSPADTEIVLSVISREKSVMISVQDQGIGIAPDQLALVFERFYRAPGTSASIKGLGLGLAIVRDLITAHGGQVWVESPGHGQGSTFWVSLPISGCE